MRSKTSAFRRAISAVACPFAAVLFLLAGCSTVTVPRSVLPRDGGNAPDEQLDYWHTIATKTLINNDEALHGLALYLDGKDDATTYDARVASLKSRGFLAQNFNQPADEALQRGTIAVALAKSLHLKGGLTVRIVGYSPRYAARELEYKGIYPSSSTEQLFTGGEFVGVIGKAEDFRAGDPTNLPASEVPATTAAAGATASAPDDEVTPILAMIAPEPADLSLRPATTPATKTTAMKVVITAVQGLASVRDNETAPWRAAKVGAELSQDAEFRTGPRGTIQFKIPPDQTVSVDRLTTLKVLQLIDQNGKVTTDLGIKYGRTRYDLEGGGLEHQSTLRSPNATLAVRGTKVSLFDQPPFAPQAISLTGRAEFASHRRGNRGGKAIAFGNKGQGKTVVDADSNTAGAVALANTVVDPNLPGARTQSEEALLTTVISRGANVTLDRDTGIKIVRGGIPPTDAQLIPALPGVLNFVLRWDSNVNLDLGVSTPGTAKNLGGEFIYPASGLNIAPSGGKTAFDHQGGPNGGIEVVYFQAGKFPDGLFALGGADLTAGSAPVTATLEAFLNGKPIDLFDGQSVTKQVVQTVTPTNPALALVAVNTPLPFGAGAMPQSMTANKRPPPPAKPKPIVGPLPFAPSAVRHR
jgi:hypothetical protein